MCLRSSARESVEKAVGLFRFHRRCFGQELEKASPSATSSSLGEVTLRLERRDLLRRRRRQKLIHRRAVACRKFFHLLMNGIRKPEADRARASAPISVSNSTGVSTRTPNRSAPRKWVPLCVAIDARSAATGSSRSASTFGSPSWGLHRKKMSRCSRRGDRESDRRD